MQGNMRSFLLLLVNSLASRPQALHEIPTPTQKHSEKGVFQIHPPVSSVNFSNDRSIPQVRVNIMESKHGTTFEISQLLTFKIKPSIIL